MNRVEAVCVGARYQIDTVYPNWQIDTLYFLAIFSPFSICQKPISKHSKQEELGKISSGVGGPTLFEIFVVDTLGTIFFYHILMPTKSNHRFNFYQNFHGFIIRGTA